MYMIITIKEKKRSLDDISIEGKINVKVKFCNEANLKKQKIPPKKITTKIVSLQKTTKSIWEVIKWWRIWLFYYQ